jgi:uncharacterized protein with HEPN domain
MQRKVQKYLLDIHEACLWITDRVKGKTIDDYISDDELSYAIFWQLLVIGEALKRVLTFDPALEGKITDAGQIIAFRNRLIHGYDTLSYNLIWGVIIDDLPRLQREIDALLNA